MLSLHTNASTLNTQNSMTSVNKTLSKSMTNLGTGFRVNTAMDDAAGLQIATRLNAQSRGMQVAQKNTQNGISMIQTAEGSMNEINNMLLRMKDLATESANGTSSQADRDALQAEFDALGKEISNILKNTTFAGSNLFSDSAGKIGDAGSLKAAGALGQNAGIKFQVGASAAETITFNPGKDGGSLNALMTALSSVSAKIGESTADSTTADYVLTLPDDTAFTIAASDAEQKQLAQAKDFADFESIVTAAGGTTTITADDFEVKQAEAKALVEIETLTAADSNFDLDKLIALADATAAFDPANVAAHANFGSEADFKAAQARAQETLKEFAAKTGLKLNDGAGPDAAGTEIAKGDTSIITTLNDAINAVGTFRSDMGAVANRLEHTFNNLGNMITNTEISKGRILDVDFAKESSNMVKNQMLLQTSTAMLKQSNSLSQMVGSLVQ